MQGHYIISNFELKTIIHYDLLRENICKYYKIYSVNYKSPTTWDTGCSITVETRTTATSVRVHREAVQTLRKWRTVVYLVTGYL